MESPRESISAQLRRAAGSLSPLDYAATVALLAVYAIGTSLDEGPTTNMDFYRAVATVIPTLLIAVAVQGRVLELARKVTFRLRYRAVLLAVVVFAGETGTLMTLARQKTNWAAHLYVYLAVLSLGVTLLYLALAGLDRGQEEQGDRASASDAPSRRRP